MLKDYADTCSGQCDRSVASHKTSGCSEGNDVFEAPNKIKLHEDGDGEVICF